MKTIWKFPLSIESFQAIDTPAEFEPLTVQVQDGKPVLWALVDKTSPVVTYHVRMLGTGWETESELITSDLHLGTVQIDGYVWHYFLEGVRIKGYDGGKIEGGRRI